jgi:hypothetical protein
MATTLVTEYDVLIPLGAWIQAMMEDKKKD